LAEKARQDLGDSGMQLEGKNMRPAGQINEGAAVIEHGADGFVFQSAGGEHAEKGWNEALTLLSEWMKISIETINPFQCLTTI